MMSTISKSTDIFPIQFKPVTGLQECNVTIVHISRFKVNKSFVIFDVTLRVAVFTYQKKKKNRTVIIYKNIRSIWRSVFRVTIIVMVRPSIFCIVKRIF